MRILYQDYILYNTYPGFSGKKKYTTLFSPYCFWGMDLGNQRQRLNIPIPHRLPRSGQWNYIWSGFSCPQEWWNQCNMDILRSKQMLPRKQTVFSSIWLCSCFFFNNYKIWQQKKKTRAFIHIVCQIHILNEPLWSPQWLSLETKKYLEDVRKETNSLMSYKCDNWKIKMY